MKPHTIEIHIEGGVVHDVRHLPPNTVVRIIDYDIDGVEPERLTTLENGDEVLVSEHWSNDLLTVPVRQMSFSASSKFSNENA